LGSLAAGELAVVATLVDAGAIGSKLLILMSRESSRVIGSLGEHRLDEAVGQAAATFVNSKATTRLMQVKEFEPDLSGWAEARILFERVENEPHVVICGAGHVGASLARLADLLGYRSTLIDDRAEFVDRSNFPQTSIDLLRAQDWSQAIVKAVGDGHGVSVAIVTRGHNEDEQCLRAVLPLGVDYIGMIGSKRRTNIVLQRLRDSGASNENLARVHAPVGLDIGAVTPEEVALAILAEIIAVRRGRKGTPLSGWRRDQ
jgi:xanthine dehydrogenase accessory factor